MNTATGTVPTARCTRHSHRPKSSLVLLAALLCAASAAQACEEDGFNHAFGVWANMRVVHALPDADDTPAGTDSRPAQTDRRDLRRLDLRSLRAAAPATERAAETKPAVPRGACTEAVAGATAAPCPGRQHERSQGNEAADPITPAK